MQWRLGRCLLVDALRHQVLVRGTGICGCLPDQLTKVLPYRRYPLVDRRNVWQISVRVVFSVSMFRQNMCDGSSKG